MGSVHIGTCGWVYRSWVGLFYPPDVAETSSPEARRQPELGFPPRPGVSAGRRSDRFSFYARHFNTVEINTTFYALPAPRTVRSWAALAPPGFVFAAKGNRVITHEKRLHGVEPELAAFFERLEPLRDKMGFVLWQFPPSFAADLPLLARFLAALPPRFRHALEFRHRSWFVPDLLKLLSEQAAALVGISAPGTTLQPPVTTDFVYLRFHGLEGGVCHNYTREELLSWAEYIRTQAAAGRTVCAYFNNDPCAHAPINARLLQSLVPGGHA